jgi:hypothetical protein
VSAFGDALNALRQVVLLHSRVEAMDQRIASLASDMDGLTDVASDLRDRVARIEGFIEGAAAASERPPRRLPRK